MKNIAIVSCKKRLNKVEDDLIIKNFFLNKNYAVDIVYWENKKNDWTKYDFIFIRSVWNSCLNYRKYIEFLIYLKGINANVINNVDEIIKYLWKSNFKKNPIFIGDDYKKFKNTVLSYVNANISKSIVLKPIIGESSYDVFRYNKNLIKTKNSKPINYIIKKIYKDQKKYGNPGVIIEKFIPEIVDGEYCIFYFNKKIVYAIKKYPSRFQERKEIEIVKKIPDRLLEYIYNNNLATDGYGRIDLINTDEIYLMEIEKNDPDLYLRILDKKTLNIILNEFLYMVEGVNNDK